MSDPKKPLCIIPARGGSKRIPRKNVVELCGKPLVVYSIEVAVASGIFAKVCVSSEDEEILTIARKAGADLCLRRPPELATDTVQVKTVCRHLLTGLEQDGEPYEAFGLLWPTNPLRRPEDIAAAYALFRSSGANAVMSVVRFEHPPQLVLALRNDRLVPFWGRNMGRTQELEKLYRHDGNVIFSKTSSFLETGEFYGPDVAAYEIAPEHTVDIDEPIDLLWAEFLLKRRMKFERTPVE